MSARPHRAVLFAGAVLACFALASYTGAGVRRLSSPVTGSRVAQAPSISARKCPGTSMAAFPSRSSEAGLGGALFRNRPRRSPSPYTTRDVLARFSDKPSKSLTEEANAYADELEAKREQTNVRMSLLDMDDPDIRGRVILVRADLNCPLEPDKDIVADHQRLLDIIPTIKYIKERGGKILLAGHIDRYIPGKGTIPTSMAPVASKLSELLDEIVTFTAESYGDSVYQLGNALNEGSVAVLENLRLHTEDQDQENSDDLAQKLALICDIFVMDDFADAHLEFASTVGVPRYRQPAVGGLLVEKEMRYLVESIQTPKRPFAAVIGGKRLSEKFEMFNKLLDKVDGVFVGGAIANTFMLARGMFVADSLAEKEEVSHARRLELKAKNKGVQLMLPRDVILADSFNRKALTQRMAYKTLKINTRVPAGWMALDLGPYTPDELVRSFKSAKTIFWNGPVGAAEMEEYSRGSTIVGALCAALGKTNRTSIVGGPDTVKFITKQKFREHITHVSTGSASFMDLMEGKVLPGLNCLTSKPEVRVSEGIPFEAAPVFDLNQEGYGKPIYNPPPEDD